MANPILPKHNNTAGVVPAAASLVTNELAINTADAVAYVKHSDGTVKQIVDPTKAPLASPALTGTPTAPTAAAGTSTTQLATTAFVTAADNLKANIASPTFNGTMQVLNGIYGLEFSSGTNFPYIDFHSAGSWDDYDARISCDANKILNIEASTISFSVPPNAPTPPAGANGSQLATTNFVAIANSSKANIASPVFTGQVFIPEGTASAPGLTFQNDGSVSNTGLYHISDDRFGVSCGGTQIVDFQTTGVNLLNTPTAPTAAAGTSTTQLATTAFVTAADNLKANIASPAFTGTPTAPTPATGTNNTQLATTNFVSESKKVQYWNGASRSYNTVYQASKNICVNVLLKGSYMNGAALMVGNDTNTTTVIGQAGDDINTNTKSASFWALIPAGMYWKVAPKDYDAFENINIIEYPFGE
jgi:hypothetical protein